MVVTSTKHPAKLMANAVKKSRLAPAPRMRAKAYFCFILNNILLEK